ncbi:MAG: hypothetical protein ABFD79_10675 [Phycisphaerales bacterium]
MKKGLIATIVLTISLTSLSFAYEDPNFIPPSPNPAQWSIPPCVISDGIYYYHTMSAMTAIDNDPPISYFFDCIEGDGISSGWILTPSYTSGPFWAVCNSVYRVRAKDNIGNVTEWSVPMSTIPEPVSISLLAIGGLLLRRRK